MARGNGNVSLVSRSPGSGGICRRRFFFPHCKNRSLRHARTWQTGIKPERARCWSRGLPLLVRCESFGVYCWDKLLWVPFGALPPLPVVAEPAFLVARVGGCVSLPLFKAIGKTFFRRPSCLRWHFWSVARNSATAMQSRDLFFACSSTGRGL